MLTAVELVSPAMSYMDTLRQLVIERLYIKNKVPKVAHIFVCLNFAKC